jgi:hypothetical protein
MGYVVTSTGTPLPEDAVRRLVEVADACRGQSQVFVVFKNTSPYEAVSVHTTEPAAQQAVGTNAGLSYFGPVVPGDASAGFYGVRKVTGTTFHPLEHPVSTVVLLDEDNNEIERFPVCREGQLTNPQVELEALMFTSSSIDKYAIPYLSKVLGVEFAVARRREWLPPSDESI